MPLSTDRSLLQRYGRWILLLFLLGLLYYMLRAFEYSQVYHPDRTIRTDGRSIGYEFEDVNFRARDGTALNGWYFAAPAGSAHARMAVLVCHGNAGNVSDRLDVCTALLSVGLNVFVFDYRGYGRSAGRPSEEGTYMDGQAAFLWLQGKGFKPEDIFVFGESLGGGVAAELALREKTAGLVLQSTFTSIPDIGAELFPWLPVRWLSTIKYDTKSKLPRIEVPVLILHSREDTLIRFRHAEENFRAANEPKLLWPIAGDHNDNLANPDPFTNGIRAFLEITRTAPLVR